MAIGDRPTIASVLGSLLALLIAEGPTCGFSCVDGAYTACNDSFPTAMPGTANCSASLGSCTGEAFCATFGDNFQSTAYPLTIPRIFLVAASNSAMDAAMQFDLELYEESGQPIPGVGIGTPLNLAIAGSQSAITVVDFALLGLAAPTVSAPGRFRICLRKQFDQMHNVCLDDNGPPSAPGRNWADVRIALDPSDPCGSSLGGAMWYASNNSLFPAIMGDFILRPDIIANDPAGLPGGGACPSSDAGVADDVGISPVDSGVAEQDAESNDDAEPGGVDADVEDADVEDTTPLAKDGEVEDAAGGGAPPEITAISPDRGKSGSPTSVTITGRSFASGLTVKIGAIGASDVTVGGSTTISATVPPGIVAATYDVVVTNPDGQAAILSDGFTVEGEIVTMPPPAGEGCGCGTSQREDRTSSALVILGLLLCCIRRGKRAG